MSRRLASVLPALALVFACGCASLPVKERVVQTVESAHAAAANAQDAELSAWNAGTIPSYTEADHQAFHAALVQYFDAELVLGQTLLVWEGGPAPESLADAIAAIQNAIDVIASVAPEGGLGTALEYGRVVLRFLLSMQSELVGGQS